MYKILALTALTTTLLLSGPSFAGTEVANGGDAIVCGKTAGHARVAELFDYYESRSLRKIQISIGNKSLSVEKKIETLISRIELISPLRAQAYREQAATFFKEALFLSASQLVPVPDSNAIAIPEGCELEQLAVQREPMFPQDERYTINKDLWNELDNDSKAGLVLHEIMYREARAYGHSTSTYVRYLNSYISSNLQQNLKTQEDIANFFVMVRFAVTDFNGIRIVLLTCGGTGPSGFCNGQDYATRLPNQFESGRLITGYFDGWNTVQINRGWRTMTTRIFWPDGRVDFYSSGNIARFNFIFFATPFFRGGPVVKIGDQTANTSFYDDAEASPKCLTLGQNFELPLATGGTKTFSEGDFIYLNQRGQVINSWLNEATAPADCGAAH